MKPAPQAVHRPHAVRGDVGRLDETYRVELLDRGVGAAFSQTVTHPEPYCFLVHMASAAPVRSRTPFT